jgi:hypothetical protein
MSSRVRYCKHVVAVSAGKAKAGVWCVIVTRVNALIRR